MHFLRFKISNQSDECVQHNLVYMSTIPNIKARSIIALGTEHI